jgi:hypothetical protein
MTRRLKIKSEWKQIELERAGSALYRKTFEMLLQHNSELVLSELRYSGILLLLKDKEPNL